VPNALIHDVDWTNWKPALPVSYCAVITAVHPRVTSENSSAMRFTARSRRGYEAGNTAMTSAPASGISPMIVSHGKLSWKAGTAAFTGGS